MPDTGDWSGEDTRSGHDRRMVIDHSQILQRHEDRLDGHEEKINNHHDLLNGFSESLNGINSNMKAVKWACIGGAIVFSLQQFGLTGTIKLWLHAIMG